MKLTKRDTKLLLVLLGILIFLAGYLGVHNRYIAKADALQAEINTLKPQLSELQEYDSRRAEFEAGIQKAQDYVLAQSARYPTAVRPENQLLYAIALRDQVGAKVGNVSFSGTAPVMELTGIRDVNGKSTFVPLSAYESGMTINCTFTYQQMKKLVDTLYATPECTALDSLSVSYDAETGSLSGAVTIRQYSVSAADDPYVPAAVPSVNLGAPDPFGTLKPAAKKDTTTASGGAQTAQTP